jgi:hypothetical protein
MKPSLRLLSGVVVLPALIAAPGADASWFDLPDGGSGFKLLKLDATPASLARSGAGVALAGFDPALNSATDSLDHSSLAAGYGATFQKFDGSLQQAAWTLPGGDWTWSALARFEGFENLQGRDEEDRSTGTYSASSWALDAGLSLPGPTEGLRVGATIGTGMDMVANASSWAGWLSLGATYRTEGSPWSAGLSIRNIGMGTTSGNHGENLPLTIQMGGAWHQVAGSWTLVPMADLKMVADEDLQFPVALEARWKILALRAGYIVGRDEALPSLGLGLAWDGWTIDVGTGWHQALGFAPAARLGFPI